MTATVGALFSVTLPKHTELDTRHCCTLTCICVMITGWSCYNHIHPVYFSHHKETTHQSKLRTGLRLVFFGAVLVRLFSPHQSLIDWLQHTSLYKQNRRVHLNRVKQIRCRYDGMMVNKTLHWSWQGKEYFAFLVISVFLWSLGLAEVVPPCARL